MPDEQWALCSTAVAAQGLAGNNSGSNVTERFVDGNTEREVLMAFKDRVFVHIMKL